MRELEEKLNEVLKDYYLLSILNPYSELLKYFILNKDGFRRNPDDETALEFAARFRGNLPQFEGEMFSKEFFEYGDKLIPVLLQNYSTAMKKDITTRN